MASGPEVVKVEVKVAMRCHEVCQVMARVKAIAVQTGTRLNSLSR